MEELGGSSLRLFFFNSGWNEIKDRGCSSICKGHWPQIKKVSISTINKISDVCGSREVGFR